MHHAALGDHNDPISNDPVTAVQICAAREGADGHVFAHSDVLIDNRAFYAAVSANPQRDAAPAVTEGTAAAPSPSVRVRTRISSSLNDLSQSAHCSNKVDPMVRPTPPMKSNNWVQSCVNQMSSPTSS